MGKVLGIPNSFSISHLRHCLKLQKPNLTVDKIGGQSVSWEDEITLDGFVRPLSGQKRLYAKHLNSELSHEIIIRYCPAVTTEKRFLFDGRILWIQTVIDKDEVRRFMIVDCREGTAS